MSVQDLPGWPERRFSSLPVTLVAVGAAAAALQGGFSAVRALWALVGLVALHVAVNAFNEASDFRSRHRLRDASARRSAAAAARCPRGGWATGRRWAWHRW